MRSAGTWGRIIDLVLADGADIGRERHAQSLIIETRAITIAETRARSIEAVGGEAVVIVVSHLSKTASVKAHSWVS